MRREYELTEEQLATILAACKPVACIQANANAAWEAMADEMGFLHMSVQPVPGKEQRFFTAEKA